MTWLYWLNDWSVVFVTTICHIWKMRNESVLEKKIRHIARVFYSLTFNLLATVNVFQGKGKAEVETNKGDQWSLPMTSYHKVNTDGCWKGNDVASGKWRMCFPS